MNHPWRGNNFMKYVYWMAGHETDWASHENAYAAKGALQ